MEQKKVLFVHDNVKELRDLSLQIQNKSTLYKNVYVPESMETLAGVMKKRSCNIFINECNNKLAFGRFCDDELLDMIEYEILQKNGFVGCGTEIGAKCLTLMYGLSERERNMWTDLLYQKSSHVNLDSLKYVFILSRNNDVFDVGLYEKNTLRPIGPFYKLKIVCEQYCDKLIFNESLGRPKSIKTKNVVVTEQQTKLGRVYVNKQNFSDLRLKKGIFKSKK